MQRKLTAIFSTDVAVYSRLMGDDEEATIRTLTAYREVIATLIQQYRGRVVDSPGDNLLAEFASVVDAVRCAVEIQQELKPRNADLPDQRKMEFRIGINLGDVVVEGERLYGDGVNIAARLEGLAEPGGICISGTVHDHIENKLALGYEYIGEQTVRNMAKPVRSDRGVRYVLAGSGCKVGERVRSTARLIDAPPGHHLWAERYDRLLQDIFALQDELVQKIVTSLKLQLSLWAQGHLVPKTTDN